MKAKGMFVVNKAPPSESETPTFVIQDALQVDLEEALTIAGAGKFQLCHCTLMVTVLTAALLEIIGTAFTLPAATCDLDIPEALRGVLTCLPSIGIILTATLWGRAADALGRKPVLVVSTAAGGILGSAAAFMPNLVGFALLKFAASLFLSCPSSLSYAFGGEMVPQRRRDFAVLMLSALLMVTSTLSPVLAWGILPGEWELSLGSLAFRPWRLLTIVYALPMVFSALLLTQVPESPKFLITKGKHQEALDVLKYVYSKNFGLPAERYPVTSLKHLTAEAVEGDSQHELTSGTKKDSALDLLRPPHLKWTALTGFLMFGVFCLLNGLFLFAPDTINKVMSENSTEDGTICVLMNQQSQNQTSNATCSDTISTDTFSIMAVTTIAYAVAVLVASLLPLSKKTLLISTFLVVGVACLMSGLITNKLVAATAMSALQLTALGIGPLTAYAVRLFPTTLRGTAVGALLMFGRLGSVAGSNVAGVSLVAACSATFYGFSTLLFVCAGLCFLLPADKRRPEDPENISNASS